MATAFIHLLDPAYAEIGPQTCVGLTGHWADYSWCAAIVLTSVMIIFLFDFGAERYVEVKYGIQSEADIQMAVTGAGDKQISLGSDGGLDRVVSINSMRREHDDRRRSTLTASVYEKRFQEEYGESKEEQEARDLSFKQQIAAFLILEFGVIFHSVIIGLNLGVVGAEFSTLYPVLIFHQSFEGLGIGARMSSIPVSPF